MHLDLSATLNLISTLAIVGALIFTGLQVRAANLTRRDQAALELIRTALSENSARGLDLLGKIPENAPANVIEEMPPQMKLEIFEFGIRWEMIGYMVYRRLLDLKTVDDLAGGTVLAYWSRAKAWGHRSIGRGLVTMNSWNGANGQSSSWRNAGERGPMFRLINST